MYQPTPQDMRHLASLILDTPQHLDPGDIPLLAKAYLDLLESHEQQQRAVQEVVETLKQRYQ